MTKSATLRSSQVFSFPTTPLSRIFSKEIKDSGIELWIKRDDLLHPFYGGNKARKLKHFIHHARANSASTLISFGGAFSNHLVAMAALGNELGFKTVGYIRGEELQIENPSLQRCHSFGMELRFVDRSTFRSFRDKEVREDLERQHTESVVIPEGGDDPLGAKGMSELINELPFQPTHVAIAIGTGTSFSGMVNSSNSSTDVIGISVLQDQNLKDSFVKFIESPDRSYRIFWDYAFGGFAKYDETLIQSINEFKNLHGIQLDPIYTGKLMFGINDLIRKRYFPEGSRVVCIHTGGLQGIEGFNQKNGPLIK